MLTINSIIFLILILFIQNITSKTTTIRSKEENCVVKHNGQTLKEGDIIDNNKKFYKVEDCGLHRAYHACGTHIIMILNIVCGAIEKHKTISYKKRATRFVQQKLLTEACCLSLCTVSEMTRYCPH